jgi:hypothetical protein
MRGRTQYPSIAKQLGLRLGFLLLCACAAQSPPHGQSAFPQPDFPPPVVLDLRALVVGRHQAAVSQASEDLQRLGFTLVQRDRLQPILDEQDRHLNDPLVAQAYMLRTGARSGAEVVVFVDVDKSSPTPSVIVQGIDVETGGILWSSGSVSTYPATADEYAGVVVDLTHRAIMDGFTKPQGGSTAVLFSHP